ncbi:ENV2 protein, partial [Pachyramphus minor]|nr:ENV2 protein [Pachyramphus minor]
TLAPEANPLWSMLQASYHVLNATYPNITKHCWLCYDIRPPFYEAIGVDSRFRKVNGTNPAQCLWTKESGCKQGITISQVSGKGKCIG